VDSILNTPNVRCPSREACVAVELRRFHLLNVQANEDQEIVSSLTMTCQALDSARLERCLRKFQGS